MEEEMASSGSGQWTVEAEGSEDGVRGVEVGGQSNGPATWVRC
jgi:hypothetical protein